jgi:peptidoglycan/LPS O-acetylase OafA/YrhL
VSLPPRLWLGDFTGGRDNNFKLLRFMAALAVILFHCYALTGHWTDEPLWKVMPELNLGILGVKIFFVISGFLVTQSWITRQRLDQFVAARVLRIYPALVAATLWTIALAALSSNLPATAFFTHPQTGDYFWRSALAVDTREGLLGAFARNPFPNAVNGSLWTLPIELRLYVALALAGVVGLLTRRALWLVAVAALTAAMIVRPRWVLEVLPGHSVLLLIELTLLFMLGSLAYAWRDALPLSLIAALAAIGLIAWNPGGYPRGALFAPLLTYVVLVAAYHPRLRWRPFNRVGDYSYGLYVYAFPIQQTIVQRAGNLEPLTLFAYAFPVALLMAMLSWHALERPALGLKSYFD